MKIPSFLHILILLPAFAAPAWAGGFPGGHQGALGAQFGPGRGEHGRPRPRTRPGTNVILRWNEIAIDASGLDHTPVAPGEARVFGEQLGPCRSSRAMAMVHLAIFEAANSVTGGYRSYLGLGRVRADVSIEAATAKAACDALAALFPSQAAAFTAFLAEDLATIREGTGKAQGIALGQLAAATVLARRADDGSQHAEPRMGIDYVPGDAPGQWRQDPISGIPLALGAHWYQVRPFTMATSEQFRLPPPPALDSLDFALAYVQVKRLGGDGVVTPTERTDEQTLIGIYWAYDGTPSLCAPPRLYNQIATTIAEQRRTRGTDLARLLALVNVAMADTGIAAWDSKYFYNVCRPITGIREADPGTGPSGLGDGNVDTVGDTTFSPLGAPASNLTGPNFTPPFPAYPSGHAAFGGALFQMLRRFYGTDEIAFTFVSDELNGVTHDNQGRVRPLVPRSFASLAEAETENALSRIYLGIHWIFDATHGIEQGRNVADHVIDHVLQPLGRSPGR